MSSHDSKVIVLVDGYAHIYRTFYAIRGLTNSAGEATNALFGVARFLLSLDTSLPNEYGAFVLDKGKCRKRIQILPEYKATRPPMPDDLRSQIPKILEWLPAAGWPVLMREGFEADDLIAGIVSQREGHGVAILSHDKDLAQLVEPGVEIVQNGKKGALIRMDTEAVVEKFGVPPEAVCDFLALVGDNVDNIQGIAGVGPKTAAKLINETGGIDQALADPERITNASLREKVTASRDLLARNLELVTLERALPEEWTGLETIRRQRPDWDRLIELADRDGLRSLVKTLQEKREADRNPTLFDFG